MSNFIVSIPATHSSPKLSGITATFLIRPLLHSSMPSCIPHHLVTLRFFMLLRAHSLLPPSTLIRQCITGETLTHPVASLPRGVALAAHSIFSSRVFPMSPNAHDHAHKKDKEERSHCQPQYPETIAHPQEPIAIAQTGVIYIISRLGRPLSQKRACLVACCIPTSQSKRRRIFP